MIVFKTNCGDTALAAAGVMKDVDLRRISRRVYLGV